ncbi:MAG: long-chain-fatty-acid--CoA ligase [Bradyrhizobium sp.]|nr:long-chain-fatty-acid--CoA ligase [Bradyrhizobium sp.]
MLGLMQDWPLLCHRIIEHAATIHGSQEVVTRSVEGPIVRTTYGEIHKRALKVSQQLTRHGIKLGDRVATIAWNTGRHLEVWYGIMGIGAICHTVNPRLFPEQIAWIINHAQDRVVITDLTFVPLLEKLADKLPSVERYVVLTDAAHMPQTTLKNAVTYESWIGEADGDFAWGTFDENTAAAMCYTSGTTGNPKGVVTHHRGAYLNAVSNILAGGLGQHPVYLWTLPMFHCNGWCFPWTMAAAAGINVCLRKVDPTKIFELIKTHGVTHMCGAPIVYNVLINAPDPPKGKRETPVIGLIAGAAPPVAVLEGAEDIGIKLTHVYGLTEVYGPASVCAEQPGWDDLPPAERAQLKRRQGVPYPLQEAVTVLNPETMQEVPRDGETIGEVMFRGNIVMKGYLKNEKATQDAFAGGWFHTGDLGVLDAHGYVIIKDRSKDIIISGGENISSVEVEDILYKHPAVLFAAVVAKPDPKWGEVPCAFIELKDGAQATEAEIIAYCRSHMSGFKTPKVVVFGPIPKTSTGKIQKFLLRNEVNSAKAISA